MTTKTAKADRSKPHVAAEDTIIEGRPVRKGVNVDLKNMSDEAFQSYVDAGLIEAEAPDEAGKADEADKTGKVSEDLSAEAARVDKTKDKRTDK